MTSLPSQSSEISIADLEKVSIDDILEALKRGKVTDNELFVSLKQVPLICFHIKSIETNMNKVISMIEKNWELSEKQHDTFLTKEAFRLEFDPIKSLVFGGVGLALIGIFGALISLVIKT